MDYFFSLVIILTISLLFLESSEKNMMKTVVESETILQKVVGFIVPKEKSFAYRFYSRFLKYSNYSVESIIVAKLVCLVAALLIIPSIKITNIQLGEEALFNSKHTSSYALNGRGDRTSFYEAQEVVFREAVVKLDSSIVLDPLQMYLVFDDLHGILVSNEIMREINYHDLKASVYNLLVNYFRSKEFNLFFYVVVSIGISFFPDLILMLNNMNLKYKKYKELIKLRTLLLISASFGTTEFIYIAEKLRERAKYYKPTFDTIIEFNESIVVSNKDAYIKLRASLKFYEEILFFEKIESANNHNYESVVEFIEHQIENEQINDQTFYKRRVDALAGVGQIYGLLLIFMTVLLMIMPYVEHFNKTMVSF